METEIIGKKIVIKDPTTPFTFIGVGGGGLLMSFMFFRLHPIFDYIGTTIVDTLVGSVFLFVAGFMLWGGINDVLKHKKFDEWIIDLEQKTFTANDGTTTALDTIQAAIIGAAGQMGKVVLKIKGQDEPVNIPGFTMTALENCELLAPVLNAAIGVPQNDELGQKATEWLEEATAIIKG